MDQAVVTLCGDETAYPAIARILEHLPTGAQAQLVLSNRSGAADYPFVLPKHVQVTLDWVRDPTSGQFAMHAATRYERQSNAYSGAFLWFAAEAAEAAEMRKAVKAAGWSKTAAYVAAYWSASKQNDA